VTLHADMRNPASSLLLPWVTVMQIRRFKPGEEMDLWHLFHDAIRHIQPSDYTPEQLNAWSPDQVDVGKWRARLRNALPFVVEHERQLIGFADVHPTGYVDHFYVHHLWQRRGVGTLLMQIILEVAKQDAIDHVFADVSVTARPFFESWGFSVEKEQYVQIHQELLKNYRMIKPIRLHAGHEPPNGNQSPHDER
jgi:GNAT superfamily N-acetyltransferase